LVAGITNPDAEQHADKDDHRQSLRAHLLLPFRHRSQHAALRRVRKLS
jgi:hypothetical protein